MPYRSPARFLAPLALVAAALTIFLVARSELGGSPERAGTGTSTSRTSTTKRSGTPAAKTTTARKTATTKASGAKTYTVKAGDNPGLIAEATGVSVAELLELNDIDAQSLRVGQKLKLAP